MLGKSPRRTEPPAPPVERVLEVTAAMQGTLSFKDPINLRISGRFDGTLETLGMLTIGEQARVAAQITGETIAIAGRVEGKVIATRSLTLGRTARVSGELSAPRLVMESGAVFNGACQMPEGAPAADGAWLSLEEVAQYLEMEPTVVRQWASQGRLPAERAGEGWRMARAKLDEWILSERAR